MAMPQRSWFVKHCFCTLSSEINKTLIIYSIKHKWMVFFSTWSPFFFATVHRTLTWKLLQILTKNHDISLYFLKIEAKIRVLKLLIVNFWFGLEMTEVTFTSIEILLCKTSQCHILNGMITHFLLFIQYVFHFVGIDPVVLGWIQN